MMKYRPLQILPLQILMVLALSSCSSNTQINTTVVKLKQNQPIILFIPGYKGSKLYEKNSSKLAWLNAREAIFGSRELSLSHQAQLGLRTNRELIADGILKQVRVIPGLYSIDIYGECIQSLKEQFPSWNIVEFSYDWRQDNLVTIAKLDELVNRLAESTDKEVYVVAHSMGGLLLSYYLRYGTAQPDVAKEDWSGADKIAAVALLGVPFGGTIISFRDMQLGWTTGLNKYLFSAEAISSFPAVYQLLPFEDKIYDEKLNVIDGLIHQEENWSEFNWGLLKNKKELSSELIKSRYGFIQDQLLKAKSFQSLIHQTSEPIASSKNLLFIAGVGLPTLDKAIFSNNQLTFGSSEAEKNKIAADDSFFLSDGDGLIPRTSANLPDAFSKYFDSRELDVEAEHSRICNQDRAIDEITKLFSSQSTSSR